MSTLDRRSFLRRGATAAVGGLLLGGPMQALAARGALADTGWKDASSKKDRNQAGRNGGYGPLREQAPQSGGPALLAVPDGFAYWAFGRTGEPMSDGAPTPDRHDGMAAFTASHDSDVVRLMRNHERGYAAAEPLAGTVGAMTYDPQGAGAVTSLLWNTRSKRLEDSFIALNGTSVNCAGGPTPWGTWLTCEETVNSTRDGFTREHGYVFEVPLEGSDDPTPLREMGRFRHEAVAIDPSTGIVYETEDSGDTSGFYRFLPWRAGDLTGGGRLQMLKVRQEDNYSTITGQRVGKPLAVEWVGIEDPDPAITTSESVFDQGFARGAATFARLEGCWFADGSVFINATSGGDQRLGQVWEYRPRGNSGGQLILLYESTSAADLDAPDNITVSPRGGLVLCEDGDDDQYLRGLDLDGRIFDLARNEIDGFEDKELAGACYGGPGGDWLFFNIQTPGVTFALTGPWDRGVL